MKFFLYLFLIFLYSCQQNSGNSQKIPLTWQYANASKNEQIADTGQKQYKPVADPQNLASLIKTGKGYLWLRSTFPYVKTEKAPLMAIYFGRLMWADQTYLNAHLIGKTGQYSQRIWNVWNTNRIYPTNSSQFARVTNQIDMKIYVNGDGAVNPYIILGERNSIHQQFALQSFFRREANIYVAFLFILISAYHLLIYLKRKKDVKNLYYACFSFFYALYSTNFFSDDFHFLGLSYLSYQKLILTFNFASAFFFIRFLNSFLQRDNSKYFKILFAICIILPVLIGWIQTDYIGLKKTYTYNLVFLLPIIAYTIFITAWGVYHKKNGGLALLYGLIPTIFFAAHDSLLSILAPTDIQYYLTGLGLPVFIGSIMFILAGDNVKMQNTTERLNQELEQLNAELEQKVIERTATITKKMAEIEHLKIQQDGDYFLTSLIENPLNINLNKSSSISTSFKIIQKKKFTFRNRTAEIGGDICVTGNLRFFSEKNKFTMFFNGDAMGKSMQGAGGAIVLGTALNNIMRRSAQNNRILMTSPHKWLTSTYQELHALFATFNGSMMISGVMGLINEHTGKMLYFNAEHPWTVLYRNQKASFIENELCLRKLGSESEFSFEIKRHLLQSGDILITGSDGRDDIDIGNDFKEINEDETLFLQLIEQSQADLDRLTASIQKIGKLTDDLSLLKIEFSLSSTLPADVDALWQEITTRIQAKDYAECIPYLVKYIHFHGENPTSYFYLSVCYKSLKLYDNAIEAGLQAYRENAGGLENLINLADAYRLAGNQQAAQTYLQEARSIAPRNKMVLKLVKLLS